MKKSQKRMKPYTIKESGIAKHVLRDARQQIQNMLIRVEHDKEFAQKATTMSMMKRLREDSTLIERQVARLEKLMESHNNKPSRRKKNAVA